MRYPILFVGLLLTVAPVVLTAAAVPARPNVLFIMADDLRPELASYGSPALTPNLDRLAPRPGAPAAVRRRLSPTRRAIALCLNS